ncbi:MAG: GNAT family N-acetyltransferase [Muribaculaceae bacterium]|nr:GNAT family N-acetyltransferase [Muribaculaceae bacterium]
MLDVIFFASDVSKVDSILKEIQNNVKLPLVLEFVVRDDNVASIGSPDKTLRRMSRYSSAYKRRTENNRTVKATHEDITDLKYLFSSHFDPLSERIPDSEELNRLIDNDGIYIIRDEDKIIGMVVYERSGVNIHLRYWWVDSSYRNMRVGGELLEQYFKAGEDCKCQFLWVFKDNANAIDKYKHYGFEFDGVRDEIFIYK